MTVIYIGVVVSGPNVFMDGLRPYVGGPGWRWLVHNDMVCRSCGALIIGMYGTVNAYDILPQCASDHTASHSRVMS